MSSWTGLWISDLRHAARRLRHARGFFLSVTLMFALGIGATTAIFSLIEGVLLRPLPFRNPDQLVQLGEHVGNAPGIGVTGPEIRAYTHQSTAFASLGGFKGASFILSGSQSPEDLPAARLNASVFPTLGVQPLLGRVFSQQEEETRAKVVVLSYTLWTDRYHRDPQILGSAIELDRKPYTVIGVMPAGFEFPLQVGQLNQARLWVPLSLTADEQSQEAAGVWGYGMVARLKDGVTPTQAAQDADRVARLIMSAFPPTMSRIHLHGDVKTLREALTGETKPLLRILLVAVAIVLLIVCANVAILMLVRAVRAHREHALRLALGARPSAILRASIVEGLLLSLTGGLIGLLLAAAAIRIALPSLSESIPRAESIAIDWHVALFALGIALLTGVLSSLVPAFVALRIHPIQGLKENAVTTTGAAGHARLRSVLVIAEVAVALVLLITSVSFLRSYQKMLAVDPGFQPQHLVVAFYRLPLEQYATPAAINAFNRSLIERLRTQPGIAAAGIGNTLPSSGGSGMSGFTIEGQPVEGWKLKFAVFGSVYQDYFQALGIPLIAGRLFTDQDRADAPPVVLINQSMARHSWPGQNPIGKRMHAGNPKKQMPWATVIGVVGDTRVGGRDQKTDDAWYASALQPAVLFGPSSAEAASALSSGWIVVRAALPPDAIAQTLRRTVAEIDPQLALDDIRPMNDVVSTTEAPRRLTTELISAFGLAALLLALTGIFAVISFSVALRRQEIAIRIALGAPRSGITRLVLRSGVQLVLAGSLLGTAGALAASRLIHSFLFEVSPTDPWIYAGSVLLMIAIAYLASLLPALRAASVHPNQALRSAV